MKRVLIYSIEKTTTTTTITDDNNNYNEPTDHRNEGTELYHFRRILANGKIKRKKTKTMLLCRVPSFSEVNNWHDREMHRLNSRQ